MTGARFSVMWTTLAIITAMDVSAHYLIGVPEHLSHALKGDLCIGAFILLMWAINSEELR